MDICDLAPGYIRAIAPYQPGKPISELARELGLDEASIVKLASNENPLGVSPLARRAIEASLAGLARYPDGNGFELKQALFRRHGVAPECIVLGNGSNDVLEMAARAFLVPGLEAVYSQHAFAVYPLAVQAVGAAGIEVPAKDYGHDLAAMRRAVTARTRLVFIANPNNPTGTMAPGARARGVHRRAAARGAGGAGRGLQRIPAGRPQARQHRLVEALPESRGDAHVLQGLRPGGIARWLCFRGSRGCRSHEPGAPAVQRQQRCAGRRDGSAR